MSENQIQVFESTEFDKLRAIEKASSYIGYVYIFEWGNFTKIGRTANPYQRAKTLKRTAEKYGGVKTGRFAVSVGHSNFVKNEKKLHEHFAKYRMNGSELFSKSFDEVYGDLPELKYENNSKELEEASQQSFESFKKWLFSW